MKIVLLESLGISQEILSGFAQQLEKQGHQFTSYEKNTDEQVQIERAQDADILIIANMPLSGRVIRACKQLRFIDVAFTGVDHVDLEAAKEMGIKVSNAAGYSTQAVAELAVCMMLSLLRNLSAVEQRCRSGQTKDGLVCATPLVQRCWDTSAMSPEKSRTSSSLFRLNSCSRKATSFHCTVRSMNSPAI